MRALAVGVPAVPQLAAGWHQASDRDRAADAEMRHQPAKRNRAVATRYDKLAVRYEATLHIAAINEWLRSGFLNTP